ncbi:MAG TPA: family 1 glycosylhydrolase [Candidatus Paceibacterota bacterium]|nr:family 1 glycosylhydrolase [Candidatus Paceibacterota bacterium]HRZ34666.1 family 1 glycosylhydrolase [Candidatus Paceibacterota bacterium]
MKKIFPFPPGFYFGAATASHQIEGGQNNDWTKWEKANAQRLARESEEAFRWNPHWSKFKNEATDPKNYVSGKACDSWNRYEEDFNLINFLGLSAYRFSIEWSRVEPVEGKFDESAISRYRGMIRSLRSRKIEPFMTIWHWTLPNWLAERGGILARDFPEKFRLYAEKVSRALGRDVKFWITLNEPTILASHAYLYGFWPPQKKSLFLYFRAIKSLIKAHKLAYEAIRRNLVDAQVGIASHQVAFQTLRPTLVNKLLKKIADWFVNSMFLRRIRKHQDFIGLNHYNRNVINNGFGKNPNIEQTDFGWEFHPESIHQALIELKKYHRPIYITENGLADAFDTIREKFIVRALASVSNAIKDGVDVRGYFYWSLLDNFEWDKGFWPRFGLVKVDPKTQERTVRDSAYVYKTIAEDRQVEADFMI